MSSFAAVVGVLYTESAFPIISIFFLSFFCSLRLDQIALTKKNYLVSKFDG